MLISLLVHLPTARASSKLLARQANMSQQSSTAAVRPMSLPLGSRKGS